MTWTARPPLTVSTPPDSARAPNDLEARALSELNVPTVRPCRLTERRGWVSLGSVLLVVIAWEAVGRRANPLFLSYPTAIGRAFCQLLLTGELYRAALISVWVYVVGLTAALVVGVSLGLLMGRSRSIRYLLEQYVYALDATPRVAFIPLLLLWCGLGAPSRIVVVFLSAVFPVTLNTLAGVRDVSARLVEIGRAFGATEASLVRKIVIPASLPFIMTGVRLAVGRSLIGLITAEMAMAVTGMGALLVRFSGAMATDKMFVVIVLLGLTGALLSAGVAALERRWTPWMDAWRAAPRTNRDLTPGGPR